LQKPTARAKVRINGKTHDPGKYKSPGSNNAYRKFVAALITNGRIAKPASTIPEVVPLIVEAVLQYPAYAEKYCVRDGIPTGERKTMRCAPDPLAIRFAERQIADFRSLFLSPACLQESKRFSLENPSMHRTFESRAS
jgi:hypothetical protein